MMKTKEPYDRELAIKNILKRSQKANNLRRARWQSRSLRIKESSGEIESLGKIRLFLGSFALT